MAKKGGTLWRIQFKKVISRPMYEKLFKNATMFVGMDVNHDWKSDMSTVGVCCSYDKYVSRFFSYIVRQHMTAELIQKLQEILFKALRRFYKENNVLPETIFIYRDGVSESQLEKVSQHEVYQVTQACHAAGSKLGIPYRPSIQFVVVQKAVSARFVSPQYSSAAPGTIVDTQLESQINPSIAKIVSEFMPKFFSSMDNRVSRASLTNCYAQTARFSVTLQRGDDPEAETKHAIKTYDFVARNLLVDSESEVEQRERTMKFGSSDIVGILKRFPVMKHEFESMQVDATIVPTATAQLKSVVVREAS
eukprot:1058169_1